MKLSCFFTISLLFAFSLQAQVPVQGCTDALALNFNPEAVVNNGTCMYAAATVQPGASVGLPDAVKETSGLVLWGSHLYTHNDDTDTALYALDTITGTIAETFPLPAVTNNDWEEMAQDEDYLYIGDFGNNADGNRNDLKILKISKESLQSGVPAVSTINFVYQGQDDYTAAGSNNTDFDCEALIVSNDSIYLFTKQWVSRKTAVYVLPKTPGTFTASLKAVHDVNGLITGAAYVKDKRLVVLTGYSPTVQPFLYLLYDFKGHDFFSGNKRKIGLSLPFHQVEGIATANGIDYYVTNERLVKIITVPQKLHRLSLAPYLQDYIANAAVLGTGVMPVTGTVRIFPNPAGDVLHIECDCSIAGKKYSFTDMTGKEVLAGVLQGDKNEIDISRLADGLYAVRIESYFNETFKLVRKK